jgi:hypothetical protein
MFADRLAQRRFVFDGEDRKVEVWWRHDGLFVVSSLRRRDPQRKVWIEVRKAIEYSEAAALITAALWMRKAQGEMP